MIRRIPLFPVLAIICVGFAKGQGSARMEASLAEETAIQEVRTVLAAYDQSTKTGNTDARSPLFNDKMLCISERFGRGETLNKDQVMDLYRSGKLKNISYAHDNIHLQAFGANTVVMTGHSTTTLRYKGRLSKGPRLFSFVFVKLNGQWQIVSQHISDIPKGDAPWN